MIKFVFFVTLALAITQTIADDTLQCYQCNPVTTECEVSQAPTVKCGGKGECVAQWKEGGDLKKALRECIIPDAFKCKPGYKCKVCKESLCNSATILKFSPIAWVGLVWAVLYL